MASTDLNLKSILFQDTLRSKPVRENFIDIQNNYNALRSEVYASIASTASEVVSARDGFDNLSDNINARKIWGGGVATGGIVTAQGTPGNTVYISTGAAICPNGVGVEWGGASSNTIAVITKPRYLVAVINSDDTLSLELGGTADDPILPVLGRTQRALGIVYQNTASPAVINNSDIRDARRQGCLYNNQYYWKIQDAVNDVTGTIGGTINVGPGNYYEDVDIKSKSNLTLDFDNDANLYRVADANYAIQCINTAGSLQTNVKIKGGSLWGNGKAGNKELFHAEYIDSLFVDDVIFDGNTAGTAAYLNMFLENCNEYRVDRNLFFGTTGDIDYASVHASSGTGAEIVSSVHEGEHLFRKVYEIGDWNMNSVGAINVAHGLDHKKVLAISLIVRNDADSTRYMGAPQGFDDVSSEELDLRIFAIDSTNVQLSRQLNGFFDSVNFETTSYNRGWLIIDYLR